MNNAYITFAEKVSDMLKIQCPKIEFINSLITKTELGCYVPNENTLYVVHGKSQSDTCFAIAHELRHKWQIENAPDMISEYLNSDEVSIEEYNLQLAEIDANAFGVIVMSSAFGIKPLFNGLSKEIKDLIYQRAEEIINNTN